MTGELQSIVRRLHRRAEIGDDRGSVPDAELLRRFVERRDEAAFELLVWRHGLMVLETCRRVLGPNSDVEDAFQATFLALLRHARHIRRRESLPGWLHRVARRIAVNARRGRLDRVHRERHAAVPETQLPTTADWADIGPVLDAEIDRLPDRFRVPFLLFHLQGMTHEETARQLGVPKGTVLSRLARARAKLRFRLTRRGVTLGGGSVLAFGAGAGELSAGLVDVTLKTTLSGTEAATAPAVVALTEGVLRTMFLNKIKIATGVMMIATTFATGGTLLACHGRFRAQPRVLVAPLVVAPASPVANDPPKAPEPEPIPPPAPPKMDRLTEVLAAYEKRRNQIKSYLCKCERQEKSKDGAVVTWKGEFRYLRPDHMAYQMVQQDNPNRFEMYIREGDKLYEYQQRTKEIFVRTVGNVESKLLFNILPIPLLGNRLTRLNPWQLFFGRELDESLWQFDLEIRRDAWANTPDYICIDVQPHTPAQYQVMKRAELVLLAKTFLVRRFWIEYRNGDQVTWDVTEIDTTTKLKPADFQPPFPRGWAVREINLPRPAPPR
jgi:RNA polymerase sigma factor (sigma-70 family)